MGRHYKLPVIKYKPRKLPPGYLAIKALKEDQELMELLKKI